MNNQSHNRITITLIIIIVLLSLSIALLYQRDQATIANLRERNRVAGLIYKQLPLLADKSQVLQFLSANGISHSDYMSDSGIAAAYGVPGIIECRLRLQPSFPYETSLHLVFRFDQDGRFQSFDDQLDSRFF
jgi:hypothetical protein